ncbi:UNVERIFIED_ORG: putative membrane protein [Xanthobacter viscosus]|uniref:DUF2157 domain-containing protein n=1 Tax=Xanthobacter autotrophicus TaxID=280 RepID=A0A6C1K9L0_XANAU|nr:DUF2157 domain-containing protein [Xanthobacter autotrophicus]TLX40830.1 DUF2157 domain-containing protein [Xanthobacter autotrophicus]
MSENVIDDMGDLAAIRVDRHAVERLASRGLITAEARDIALTLIEPPRRWGLWAGRLLGTAGAALVLSGIIYFFAFNWNRIPPLTRLGVIAALIAAACLTVVILGFGRRVSETAAAAAVTLVGVFLAVAGQIYQTGADAWTLFAAWAGLTLAWTLLAGSAATWAVWIAVAAVTIITWWDQTQPADTVFHSGRNLSLMALFGIALLSRETLAARGIAWLTARWTRFFLGVPLLAATVHLAIALLEEFDGFRPAEEGALVAIPLCLAAMAVVYRRPIPDLAMLAAVALSACIIADFGLFRLLASGGKRADIGTYFIMGVATLALFAAAIAWLRATSRKLEVRP